MCVCVCLSLDGCVCVCVSVCLSLDGCVCVCLWLFVYVCVYVSMCVRGCVSVYVPVMLVWAFKTHQRTAVQFLIVFVVIRTLDREFCIVYSLFCRVHGFWLN